MTIRMNTLFMVFIGAFKTSIACTAFGIVTESSTIIGKNRDAVYYTKQQFELVMPQKQFDHWYNNKYNHKNKFYALMVDNDVKMGINESGVSIIEEDPLYPETTEFNRKYFQPINGNAEGMVLYGILQNFSTIDEIMPYINQIFSVAAPNFYQIADNKKILLVEVAYGASNIDMNRKFSYKLLQTKKEYFIHTNTYLSSKFKKLNKLEKSHTKFKGSEYRLNKIEWLIKNKPNDYLGWFMDTSSTLANPTDPTWCLNTSIFRSNLHGLEQAYNDISNHEVYGTVSNFVVINNIDAKKTTINVKIIENINVQKDGSQVINYKELQMPINKLFITNTLNFKSKEFTRKAPMKGVCL